MIVDGHEMTASHSEADIYKGCVALMQELMERFEEYLEYVGFEPDSEEERFATYFYPTRIVERLFLWNTRHSGGTSQHLKCQELGIDTDNTVIFEDSRNAEEQPTELTEETKPDFGERADAYFAACMEALKPPKVEHE